MSRPSRDETWLRVAYEVARRSTCLRRAVGCVLLDAKGRVLATGYNGVAAGEPHCNEAAATPQLAAPRGAPYFDYPHACPGATAPSGSALSACAAVHAEANALLQCRDPDAVVTCYVTASPCVSCTKLLMNTGCRHVVYCEPYAHDEAARALWLRREAARQERYKYLTEPTAPFWTWRRYELPADEPRSALKTGESPKTAAGDEHGGPDRRTPT